MIGRVSAGFTLFYVAQPVQIGDAVGKRVVL